MGYSEMPLVSSTTRRINPKAPNFGGHSSCTSTRNARKFAQYSLKQGNEVFVSLRRTEEELRRSMCTMTPALVLFTQHQFCKFCKYRKERSNTQLCYRRNKKFNNTSFNTKCTTRKSTLHTEYHGIKPICKPDLLVLAVNESSPNSIRNKPFKTNDTLI